MATVESFRSVRDHLSEVVDRVEQQLERVVITRNGRDAAVVISTEDLAALEVTLSVLGVSEALADISEADISEADIREADAASTRGDVIRGVDAVRGLAR